MLLVTLFPHPCFIYKDNVCLLVCLFVCLMVLNVTFNNILVISWRCVLLVEETRGPRENHRPVASHWQTLWHNVVRLALIEIRTNNISGDRHWFQNNVIALSPHTTPLERWRCGSASGSIRWRFWSGEFYQLSRSVCTCTCILHTGIRRTHHVRAFYKYM